jgi:hypothetical protein
MYAINIPFSDDYLEILKNMNLIMDSGSFSESMQHLLYGNGYSKPITLRLISLLQLSIWHEINFKYLVITGNVFLLLICCVFVCSAARIHTCLAISAACFIFQPQYWEAIYQSTLANSVFSCLFFSLASIWCVMQRKTGWYAASLICALLAQLSFGNGFLVYPVLLMAAVLQKNIRLFIAICIMSAVCTWGYMLGTTVPYTAGVLIGLLEKLKLCSLWMLEFIGSSVGYVSGSGYARDMVGRVVSMIIGGLVVSFYLFLIRKRYYDRNLLLFAFLTFFMLTAILAAKLRFATEVPGASRYQIQSALCILTTLYIIIDLYASRMNTYMILLLTIVFPVLFVLISYKTNMNQVSMHKTRLATGMISWMASGKGLTIWEGEDAAGRLLLQSNSRGLYRIPSNQSLYQEIWK